MKGDPCIWTDDMGEISGLGRMNPGYEAKCRRMVQAGADWLGEHSGVLAAVSRIPIRAADRLAFYAGPWDRVFSGDTPHGHELLQTIHRACCADGGDAAAPTAAMMEATLEHVRAIERLGWDAFAAERRRLQQAWKAQPR